MKPGDRVVIRGITGHFISDKQLRDGIQVFWWPDGEPPRFTFLSAYAHTPGIRYEVET